MKKQNTLLLSIITVFLISISSYVKAANLVDIKPSILLEEQQVLNSSKHPFLIVTKEMYPELRKKADKEPWKSMKKDAIMRSNKTLTTSVSASSLQEYIGAAALAYILDEPNSRKHAHRVSNTIINQYSKLKVTNKNGWTGIVPPMGALFVATLCLDIVYDELTESEIIQCEKIIGSQIAKASIEGSWGDARRGTHGTWDIYKGKRTTPDDDYFKGIMKQITPDGVSPVTNTYAWARIGGSINEVSKSAYMDVLEFTGIDKRYYNNERLIKFQRWLYGSSVDCAKNHVIFGDMLPTAAKRKPAAINWRVINFDYKAAQYAAWLFEGETPPGHILSYILPKSSLPSPKVPSSQLYENGGAFLRDKEDNPNGLQLTLYNIKSQDEWHTHNEVNGLSLSALGNRLLVNGGRLGAPVRAAYLNNTLTINGENHSSRLGGGIIEGFSSDELAFAVGSSGPALSSASHLRNTILVHTAKNTPGYFIIFDEVDAKKGQKVKNYLHPANETTIAVVEPLTEYIAEIDHYPTAKNVSASFYYLTPPNSLNIKKVPSTVPDSYPNYPDHNRLEAVYNIASNGSKNITTLIYPFSTKKNISKANIERIEGENMNACTVSHGNTIDYIFETMPGEEIKSSGISFKANFCLVRKTGNKTPLYFVKNGTSITLNKLGFQSDKAITIYANGTEGKIITSGAIVRLMGPDMGGVNFTPSAEKISSGADFIEVKLGRGTYSFQ